MPPNAAEVVMEGAIGISTIIWMTLILFWILSPIAGFYLFKVTRRKLPTSDAVAFAAMGLCGFLVIFALTLLFLLQAAIMDATTAFLVSAISALIVTLICIFAVRTALLRSHARVKASAEEHAFRVWDEDHRGKPKNLRKKRY